MKVLKYQLCTEVNHGTEMASTPLRMMVSRSLHPPRLTASRPKWHTQP